MNTNPLRRDRNFLWGRTICRLGKGRTAVRSYLAGPWLIVRNLPVIPWLDRFRYNSGSLTRSASHVPLPGLLPSAVCAGDRHRGRAGKWGTRRRDSGALLISEGKLLGAHPVRGEFGWSTPLRGIPA
jgi:hypothetical protein